MCYNGFFWCLNIPQKLNILILCSFSTKNLLLAKKIKNLWPNRNIIEGRFFHQKAPYQSLLRKQYFFRFLPAHHTIYLVIQPSSQAQTISLTYRTHLPKFMFERNQKNSIWRNILDYKWNIFLLLSFAQLLLLRDHGFLYSVYHWVLPSAVVFPCAQRSQTGFVP